MIMLVEGDGPDDALLLQMKEAGPSVLEPFLPAASYKDSRRVVMGQRLIQAVSDIFLGWHTSRVSQFEYYWRQFKDLKGSAVISELDPDGLETYMKICATCLARAHARTGDEAVIAGYIGDGKVLADSMADFSEIYADQAESDYQALVEAVESGRIEAQTGI